MPFSVGWLVGKLQYNNSTGPDLWSIRAVGLQRNKSLVVRAAPAPKKVWVNRSGDGSRSQHQHTINVFCLLSALLPAVSWPIFEEQSTTRNLALAVIDELATCPIVLWVHGSCLPVGPKVRPLQTKFLILPKPAQHSTVGLQ